MVKLFASKFKNTFSGTFHETLKLEVMVRFKVRCCQKRGRKIWQKKQKYCCLRCWVWTMPLKVWHLLLLPFAEISWYKLVYDTVTKRCDVILYGLAIFSKSRRPDLNSFDRHTDLALRLVILLLSKWRNNKPKWKAKFVWFRNFAKKTYFSKIYSC